MRSDCIVVGKVAVNFHKYYSYLDLTNYYTRIYFLGLWTPFMKVYKVKVMYSI